MRLIKTGMHHGLSSPISLESNHAKATAPLGPTDNSIITDFEAAIDFMMALELRGLAAGPVDVESEVYDSCLGGDPQRYAEDLRYSGAKIIGPSTSWSPSSYNVHNCDISEFVGAGMKSELCRNGLLCVLRECGYSTKCINEAREREAARERDAKSIEQWLSRNRDVM